MAPPPTPSPVPSATPPPVPSATPPPVPSSGLVRLSIGAPVSEAVSEPNAPPPVAVRLVLQRATSSRILLNADSSTEEWFETGAALVAYVSFTAEMERCAKPEQARRIEQAVRAMLHFPLMTHGQWGDGQKTLSALALCVAACQHGRWQPGAVSFVLVPQASLSCKIRPDGRGASYRALADKEAGAALYASFVGALQAACTAALSAAGLGGAAPSHAEQATAHEEELQRKRLAALVPPDELFRRGEHTGQWGAWDARGVPTADAVGAPLAKNALKKLEKVFAAHCKSHEKELARVVIAPTAAREGTTSGAARNGATAAAETAAQPSTEQHTGETAPLRVIAGTYGCRQGLSMDATCGPFVHMMDL